MVKRIFIILGFIYLSGFIIAQPKIDSLKNLLKSSTINNKIEICYLLDSLYINSSSDSVINYANYGLSLIDENHVLNRKLDFIRYLGTSYFYQNKYKLALKFLQQALDGYESNKNINKQVMTINTIGVLYGQTCNYDKALSYFQRSLSLSNQQKDTLLICISLTNIGLVSQVMNDYKTALSNFEKALVLSTQIKHKLNIAHTLNDISNTYSKMQDYNMALKYNLKALQLSKELNDNRSIAHVSADIGETYKKLNNINMSLKYFEEAYLISKNLDDELLISGILSSIGDIYITKKNYDKAKEYLDKAQLIATKIENKETLKDVYESFSRYYAQQNDYQKALSYYKRFKEINDSIYSKESSDKIAELQIKFDIKEKENENEILRQKTEIQQLAINKQIYLRDTFIYISIIITLLVIFVFFRYWLKQKANKVLSEKNELINKQKNQLEEVYKMKDKLFAVITHDMKNPLSSLLTLCSFIENDFYNLSDNHKLKGIESLKRSIVEIYNLIENLTDWLNAKGDNIIMDKTKFNLSTTINSVLKLYTIPTEQKSISLQTHIEPYIFAFGDERMIKTVLRNLLDNALKFTFANGNINISVSEKDDRIIVAVSDTGMGIDEVDKDKLFKLETSLETKNGQYEKGGGFGLILCKEFIEKNEGEIWFESEVGIGSTFYFSIIKYV